MVARWSWGLVILQMCIQFSQQQDVMPYVPDMPPRERCRGTVIKGPCTDWVEKWYFNQTIQACRIFTYGGCKGENVFNSEAECLHYCIGGDHTLPPYLQFYNGSRLDRRLPKKPKLPPVPHNQRGRELTFPETGRHKVFMMAKSNAFIQLDGNRIPTFQLRLCREISFQFKTRLPHGLLVYHSIKDRPENLDPYALYVIVEKGQLKVVHVFGKHSTSVIVGEGLNRDRWHSVTVTIDVHGARLIAKVDEQSQEVSILGLDKATNYRVMTDLTSVVLIGGLSPEEKLHGVKYIIESFVGCIKDMVLSAGKAASDLLPIKPLIATKHDNVLEGCIDKCMTRENLCFVGSKCINHYNRLSCDCFGTNYEGEQCDIYTATILTLRGSSYVSYRVYDWKDRVHSRENRIGLHFKTFFNDSVLFYASGESPGHHHIAVSIVNFAVVVDINLGAGNMIKALGSNVTDNQWHNLTIVHVGTNITVYLDNGIHYFNLTGAQHHLYIDPEIYIGGGPELYKKKGLHSMNNFVGSLKYVFFNDVSILYELNKTTPKVHYIGVLQPAFYEEDVDVIPMTFPFPASYFWWPSNSPDHLFLSFDFKTNKSMAVLASSNVRSTSWKGYWELRLMNEELRFELTPDGTKNTTNLTAVKFDRKGDWHNVELSYNKGEVHIAVDQKHRNTQAFEANITLDDKIIIGTTLMSKTNIGLVGCLREVIINGVKIEPRFVVRTEHMIKEVSLDNCELVDPCKRPNACEHNGKCSVREDQLTCDCTETGYIGKNCHFAKYRKTCEELALLGYTEPDVYLIDIDGNGKFPPAHVKCEFQSLEDSTKTIVEHNLPSQVDVRSAEESDFSFAITYREFTSEMLQELISHSLYCSQYIKYDCYKAPLELHSATWFVAAANNGTVDYIGNVKRGSCPCAENRTCVNPDQSCNCDISEAKWLSDEGHYISSNSLGITQMVFLQQKDLEEDAQGRITLGPLECVETNTQKYVVTFTTSQSYIEVPGWRKGDIAFSFRTTGEKAILLYQPPIRAQQPSFMVALTSDFQLTFNFTLNTGKSRELEIKSQRKLNSGEWQKIWIDYNEHHVRFMINTDYQMVDLLPEEEFGPFEGSMFIGGATEDLLVESTVHQGLIGCFRGLVVNGEILDIYSYMSVHLSEIIKDCKPSCDPNPCKNGATCKELWSTFQCVCENPWAYIGTFCENNINENGMTFIERGAVYKKNYLAGSNDTDKLLYKRLLNETILLNVRTYDEHSLILHANDHLNNFIQLLIYEGSYIVFLFNSGNTIHNVTVEYQGLNNGKSMQVAIVRNLTETWLHVNERNNSVPATVDLLTEYSDKPWQNPENEILAPQRPPAPPTEYFQFMLGGYDSLLSYSKEKPLEGYVGCIRGLKIGETVINFTNIIINNPNKTEVSGMVSGCNMKCDELPCKNQGICIEDFSKGESTCDCELTSYYGEFCDQEKGADFGGESVLQRKFTLEGPVGDIRVQLAFSSSDTRQRSTVLLLLQTEHTKSYYLLVALGSKGELIFEEDREGSSFGATIVDRNFLNGARHSVYYKRTNESSALLIDRDPVAIGPIRTLSLTDVPDGHPGTNEVQIGGLNTSDPRFTAYISYQGCLSNVFLEVNNYSMKPLDEYMLFTKTGSVEIYMKNFQGVRSAQCSFFDTIHKPRPGPSLNISYGNKPEGWVEDAPAKIPYKSLYSDPSTKEEGTGRVLFIIATTIFCVVITATLYHVYRTHVAYKKRKEVEAEAAIMWHNSQIQYQDPPPMPIAPIKAVRSRSQDETVKPSYNGGSDPKGPHKLNSSMPSVVRFKQPFEEEAPPVKVVIENGSVPEKVIHEEEEVEEEEGTQLLPTNEEALPKPPSEVISQTINEDDAGEREEELNQEQETLNERPKSVDLTDKADTDLGGASSLGGSITSMSSQGRKRRESAFKRILGPLFLSERVRTFSNPISYLGGPRNFPPKSKRSSIDSVLSID